MGEDVRIICGDALEILPTLDRSEIAAVVTDPPWGMNLDTDYSRFNGWHGKGIKHDPIIGDDSPFDPTPWLGVGGKHIFWGAQYYCHKLPQRGGWLVFNKRGDGDPSAICFGDCELAWTDEGQAVRMYSQQWHGVARWRWSKEGRHHPAQKPIGLMAWCLEHLRLPQGSVVLDPYGGSGTTAVACLKAGLRCIVIEKYAHYVEVIRRRVREAETPLFDSLAPGADQ